MEKRRERLYCHLRKALQLTNLDYASKRLCCYKKQAAGMIGSLLLCAYGGGIGSMADQ
jgi:hypothetical protein